MSEKTNGTSSLEATDTAANDGRVYWRSMEQLAASPAYQEEVAREFPEGADSAPADDVSRRGFLSVVAAAVAMAGATACRKPGRKILPFNNRPEDLIPGVPRHFATTLPMQGYGTGVLVTNHDGRPTKIEGNPLHPASLGSSDVYMQGELLNLYDPARSTSPCQDGEPVTLEKFLEAWGGAASRLGNGEKLAFLMGPTASPTTEQMVDEVRGKYPAASFHTYRPIHRDNEIDGSNMAFGRAVDAQYDFAAADVVVSLDADFLGQGPNSVRHSRDFASRRRVADGATLNRLYSIEPGISVTGGQADHRFRVRAHQVADVLFGLAAEMGVLQGSLGQAVAAHKDHGFSLNGKNWVRIIGEDLFANRGKCLVVAGSRQPAVVHAVVHALNAALGNVGKTVTYTATPALASASNVASLRDLADKMDKGAIDTLFILGGNPVQDAPADLAFAEKLAKVPNRIHHGLYYDETAAACNWHLNGTHDLEAWGDSRSHDGTASVIQPMVAPLFNGISEIELLARVAEYDETEGYTIVRYYWEDNTRADDLDAWWNRALHDGLVHDSASSAESVSLQLAEVAAAIGAHSKAPAASRDNLEVTFAQDATVYDGRYRNNSWMQECPDPVTKLTWDNAAVMSRKTAEELGVDNGDMVSLSVGGAALEIPVWVVPGLADYSIALTLGYNPDAPAQFEVAQGAGFNTYQLRTSGGAWMASGGKASRTGGTYALESTQDHGSMQGRDHYRQATAEEFAANPTFAPDMSPLAQAAKLKGKEEKDLLKSLWKERDYSKGPQWGMVIDLNSCNGCNACVVACQAENNIPSVGKGEVATGREMHWLRVDRYYATPGSDGSETEETINEDAVAVAHQPVPCMHCENAPCESVCPVAATVHSPDGLNGMTYNRCIGTRYCSNNCPYKVRKFNWFDFIGELDPTLQMAQNPNVTIRNRGVMEKCTYCVQRISVAKHTASKEGRPVLDGEVVPACGQACPSQAITFGDIVDTDSRVHELRNSPLNYAMLSELNVKPRTTYLAKIRNPNPELS